jgi:hypothetical protein
MVMLLTYVLVVTCCAFANSSGTEAIRKTLATQGFTGALDGKIAIKKLGVIAVGPTAYQIFSYIWEESCPPGAAIHASQRIVVMAGTGRYIGSYSVEDPPTRLVRNAILFGYSESLGNRIRFDRNGPPTKIHLNGELHIFAK